MKTKKVHISTINQGDTVIHRGQLMTVGKSDIRYSSFMGWTLFGDSYKLGYEPVILKSWQTKQTYL